MLFSLNFMSVIHHESFESDVLFVRITPSDRDIILDGEYWISDYRRQKIRNRNNHNKQNVRIKIRLRNTEREKKMKVYY